MECTPKRGSSQSLVEPFKVSKSEQRDVAQVFDKTEAKRKFKFENCASVLVFDHCRSIEHFSKLHYGNFCNDRLCFTCQWLRARAVHKKIQKVCANIIENKQLSSKFALLTLTIPNCEREDLSDSIRQIISSFTKLRNRAEWNQSIEGFFRSIEVTYNEKTDSFHPHMHVMLHLKKSYYGSDYIKRDRWLELWRECTKNFNITQVDIRGLRTSSPSELAKSTAEVCKYSVKPSVLKVKDRRKKIEVLKDLKDGIYAKRLINTGGSIRNEIGQKILPEDQLDEGWDDTEDPGLSCPTCSLDLLRTWFGFSKGQYEYLLQKTLRELENKELEEKITEWKFCLDERHAIEGKQLRRGTFFYKPFSYQENPD